jgi:hypothetical protein
VVGGPPSGFPAAVRLEPPCVFCIDSARFGAESTRWILATALLLPLPVYQERLQRSGFGVQHTRATAIGRRPERFGQAAAKPGEATSGWPTSRLTTAGSSLQRWRPFTAGLLTPWRQIAATDSSPPPAAWAASIRARPAIGRRMGGVQGINEPNGGPQANPQGSSLSPVTLPCRAGAQLASE